MGDLKETIYCGSVCSETLPLCTGQNITPRGVNGPLVAKIPVVLAEKDIQIDVEADIDLKEDYFEIKRIKKNVYLTQCRLLPTSGERNEQTGELISGKLFLEGYVEKNFEYATACCATEDVVSGNIKHTTVKVPFRCVTEVYYARQPIYSYRGREKEMDLYLYKDGCHKECKEGWMGKYPCETDYEESIYYVEKPYCELEGARIYEADMHRDECYKNGIKVYGKIVEKMVVYLRIKVLQLQQVNIDC